MGKEIVMTLNNGVQIAIKATLTPPGVEIHERENRDVALNYVLLILRQVPSSAFAKDKGPHFEPTR